MTDNYSVQTEAENLRPQDESERELLILLLDTSGSMGERHPTDNSQPPRKYPTRIAELNAAVNHFMETSIHAVPGMDARGEIAVATFNHDGVQWLQLPAPYSAPPFHFINDVRQFAHLTANGRTPLAEAILDALVVLEQRKAQMRDKALIYAHRPNVFLITDGKPSSSYSHVPGILRQQEADKKLLFWILGVDGADDEVLQDIASQGAYYSLKGISMAEIIDFLSASLGIVESMGGDQPAGAYYERTKALARDILRKRDENLLGG